MKITTILMLSILLLASKRPDKASSCEGCHGSGGKMPLNPGIPKIAGQNSFYLKKQLKDFRSGYRKSPDMSHISKKLTDDDIENLAKYFANQVCK